MPSANALTEAILAAGAEDLSSGPRTWLQQRLVSGKYDATARTLGKLRPCFPGWKTSGATVAVHSDLDSAAIALVEVARRAGATADEPAPDIEPLTISGDMVRWRSARDKAVAMLHGEPWFVGAGLCELPGIGPAVAVRVLEENDIDNVPDEIDGFPTDVAAVGPIRAQRVIKSSDAKVQPCIREPSSIGRGGGGGHGGGHGGHGHWRGGWAGPGWGWGGTGWWINPRWADPDGCPPWAVSGSIPVGDADELNRAAAFNIGDRVQWVEHGPIACFAPPCDQSPGVVENVVKTKCGPASEAWIDVRHDSGAVEKWRPNQLVKIGAATVGLIPDAAPPLWTYWAIEGVGWSDRREVEKTRDTAEADARLKTKYASLRKGTGGAEVGDGNGGVYRIFLWRTGDYTWRDENGEHTLLSTVNLITDPPSHEGSSALGGVGWVPGFGPSQEEEAMYRALRADWESFERQGVGITILRHLRQDLDEWRAFRDSYDRDASSYLTATQPSPLSKLNAEVMRANRVRRELQPKATPQEIQKQDVKNIDVENQVAPGTVSVNDFALSSPIVNALTDPAGVQADRVLNALVNPFAGLPGKGPNWTPIVLAGAVALYLFGRRQQQPTIIFNTTGAPGKP